MKGLNFDVSAAPEPAAVQQPSKVSKQDSRTTEVPSTPDPVPSEPATDVKKSKKEKKREMAAAAQKEKEAAAARKARDTAIADIAQKTAKTASSSEKKPIADVESGPVTTTSGHLLLEPTPQWMDLELEALPASPASSSSQPVVTHEQALRLLARGNELLDQDNDTYHSMLNSGSSTKLASLGGLTPSDAKYIASLLGDGTSASGTGKSGGTLSDRIAAHALLLGSSPIHNLRSLEALLTMASKKSREESGRATRALADWFSGAGLGSRKLRYMRDQPELVLTAATPGQSRGKDQRLAFFAFEDRLKKAYFTFLQTLEHQGHDTLKFVREQAVTQVYLLLKEKSEQEQNLLRLLVNKLGDGERSVASKSMNSLLELLNVHSAMKAIVAQEITDLIRRPTRSSTRQDHESTKKHHNHAKYYGVLTLNQIMLTREDAQLANTLVHLYFELFEQALANESLHGDANGKNEEDAEQQKKKKDRWRDNKGKKGGKGGSNASSSSQPSIVQDAEGKMMAAVLTGVRRAFPFAQVETNIFDKYLNTLFRITHAASFNIAIQALQLIQVLATSSTTSSSTLLDRFHSTLYSSMLDPRLATTSKTAMYLNLCYKAMRDDVDDERRAAEIKRLMQVLAYMDAEFICGALFLIGELFRAHPRLRGMLSDPEDDDEEIIVQPPDDESEDDQPQAKPMMNTTTTAAQSTTGYDPVKRDPRYARATSTCFWDLVPLLKHFHPTVQLLSRQLLQQEKLTTSPDLTLYTLSHFLDKFVYRNPKKTATLQKGASGMQPAVSGSHASDGAVRMVKGWQGSKEDEVNTERFWKMKAEKVPVDSLFFHHYFNLKEGKDGKGKKATRQGDDEDEDESDAASDVASSLGSDDVDAALKAEAGADEDEDDSDAQTDDEAEKEIWAAMKRSMPSEEGDADVADASDAEGDDSDEDLSQFDYTDSEDGSDTGKINASDVSDGEEDEAGMFDEDEDDLLPFADFEEGSDESSGDEEEEQATTKGKKRSRDDAEDEEGDDQEKQATGKNHERNKQRRQEKKKRKAMPMFASAEDYAHLLGDGSDGE